MKEISLTKGYIALVDDDKYDYLMQWKWTALVTTKTIYAKRHMRINGGSTTILMHRVVCVVSSNHQIDHIDGDGLNNQQANLRPATSSQNLSNRQKYGQCSSKFKGVYWQKSSKRWCAQISINRKNTFLGFFDSEEAAALAYNDAAVEHYGEFANINILGH